MSGEFGQYDYRGYIDDVISAIAEECLRGDEVEFDITRSFGTLLEKIAVVAKDIAYLEACDSGEFTTARSINAYMPRVREALDRFSERVEKCLNGE